MPKILPSTFPVSGLFGIIKPSGPTSMSVVNDVQQVVSRSRLFVEPEKLKKIQDKKMDSKRGRPRKAVKVGQGGTLDPMADGVLVIGVGKGTKKLNDFLDGSKEYETTCLLGCETDSYDNEGARVRLAPWRHVSRELVEATLPKFRGDIQQVPPIFSALKMDGRPLYEYARKGIPLPRAIEARQVKIESLEIVKWLGSEHSFKWPKKELTSTEKIALEQALKGVEREAQVKDEPETMESEDAATAFVLRMRVSKGTYVRSIVHDLANAMGSAGHAVTLTRTRHGPFVLEEKEDGDRGCVPWETMEKALGDAGEVDDNGWTEWERSVMQHFVVD